MMILVAKILLFFLKLRYSITLHGFPKDIQSHSYLVLPNHVSYIEPMLLRALFMIGHCPLRPVVTSKFAKDRRYARFFRKIGVIVVEDSEQKNNMKELAPQLQSSLDQLQNVLQKGESVLLFPSGQLAGQGSEYLGGKKSAFLAVPSLAPETKILTVRVRGLRGSMRSKAWTGESPSFLRIFAKACWFLIANGFFFLPKRKVEITFSEQTEHLQSLAQEDLQKFNQALELFYNQKGEEQLHYGAHYRYYNDVKAKKLPAYIHNSLDSLQKTARHDYARFDPKVIEQIKAMIIQIKDEALEQDIQLDQHLIFDLYLDSLDMAELKNMVMTTFPLASNMPILELKTVADLVAMAMGISAKISEPLKPCHWNQDLDAVL